MIRSQDMVKVTLIAHQQERYTLIERLHGLGILQLIDLRATDVSLDNAQPGDRLKDTSDLLLRTSHLITIMRIAPQKLAWQQKLFGLETLQTKTPRKDEDAVFKDAVSYLQQHEARILNLEKQWLETIDAEAQHKELHKVIDLLVQNDLPVDVLGRGKSYNFTVGEIQSLALPKLEAELKKELKNGYHLETRHTSKKAAIVVIAALAKDHAAVDLIAKKHGVSIFAFPAVPQTGDPLAWIESQVEQLAERENSLIEQIAKEHSHLDNAIFLREELELLKERAEAIHKLKQSTEFFALQGWAIKKDVKTLKSHVKNAHIIIEDPTAEDEPPVKLSNPAIFRPFEVLTELYALPKYKDLDPTFIVAPLFLIYAGFMLTDFVYGLGLVILGAIIYMLFRKQQSGVKDISVSIFFIGAFSMLFGVLTGSYLGDAPKYFFGLETAQLAIWADPLADPMIFLKLSLAVGLVHLNIGLLLGALEDFRKKEYRQFLADRATWWILQLGIGALILLYMLDYSKYIYLSPLVFAILWILYFHNLLGILGATGFMGDVISYSRLFALALSTAGIAMTVNLLAGMLAPLPYIGLIAAALIFIGGHLFSFAMNALGSFVHSIRLQFVEFFGKFYEGGGEKFTPFEEDRVYTEARK